MLQQGLDTAFFTTYFKRDNSRSSHFLEEETSVNEEVLRDCEKFSQELKRRIDTINKPNGEIIEEKQLLESEYYTWTLLARFIKADIKRNKIIQTSSFPVKNEFFKKFSEYHKEGKHSLSAPSQIKHDDSYIPLSQYDLVNDIVLNNELIFHLNYIVDWLSTTGIIDEHNLVSPIIFNTAKQENRNVDLEPDRIFNEKSNLDDRTRYENRKLLKAIFEYLRCGKIVEAYDLLVNCKQTWRAITLNGGLPFHDFYYADEIKSKSRKSDEFKKEIEEDKTEPAVLDFMKNKEWKEISTQRHVLYSGQMRNNNNVNELFFETFGNSNWLLWLTNCWSMSSMKDTDSYERGIYAILSSNAEILRSIFKEDRPNYWYNIFWTELRSILYLDVIRRYISLFDLFKDRIPLSDVNGEDPDSLLNTQINAHFKKTLLERGLIEDEVKELLRELDTNEDLNNYNRLQLKLIESKIYSISDKSFSHWNNVFGYIKRHSQLLSENYDTQKLVGHKLRFSAYFLKTIEKLGFNFESLKDSADEAMSNYVKYLIRENASNYVIPLYNEMNFEKFKIEGIASFLARIDNQELRLQYKNELEKYAPHLAKEIIKEIFNLNQRSSLHGSLETERKRFESLKWLNLNEDQLRDAIREGLHLIRMFLVEDNIEAAIRLKVELVDNIFIKASTKLNNNPDDLELQTALHEKQEHDRLFEAYKAYKSYNSSALQEYGVSDAMSNYGSNKPKLQSGISVSAVINKILVCLFGPYKEKRNVIYNLSEIFQSPEQIHRAEGLRAIQRLWTYRLISWLIDIYENNLELSKADELLTSISNPDCDCLYQIEENDKVNMIKKLATLMINDSGFIASLLIGNKTSAQMEMEVLQGSEMQ